MLRRDGVPSGSGAGKLRPSGGLCAVLGPPLGCPVGTLVALDVAVSLDPVEPDDGEVTLYRPVEATETADTCGHVTQRPTPLEGPHNYKGVRENEEGRLTSEESFSFGLGEKLKAHAEALDFAGVVIPVPEGA